MLKYIACAWFESNERKSSFGVIEATWLAKILPLVDQHPSCSKLYCLMDTQFWDRFGDLSEFLGQFWDLASVQLWWRMQFGNYSGIAIFRASFRCAGMQTLAELIWKHFLRSGFASAFWCLFRKIHNCVEVLSLIQASQRKCVNQQTEWIAYGAWKCAKCNPIFVWEEDRRFNFVMLRKCVRILLECATN